MSSLVNVANSECKIGRWNHNHRQTAYAARRGLVDLEGRALPPEGGSVAEAAIVPRIIWAFVGVCQAVDARLYELGTLEVLGSRVRAPCSYSQ